MKTSNGYIGIDYNYCGNDKELIKNFTFLMKGCHESKQKMYLELCGFIVSSFRHDVRLYIKSIETEEDLRLKSQKMRASVMKMNEFLIKYY